MSKLAVIATFYKRHENTMPLLHRLFVDGTYEPDEVWLMCETEDDYIALNDAWNELYELELVEEWPPNIEIVQLATPKQNGVYTVIPYSHKINYALDRSKADYFVYLDNNSMPDADKFKEMKQALDDNPEWGAVYCTQKRTGWNEMVFLAEEPVENAFCVLNFTQVMHRRTEDRWTLDMRFANPDLADAYFWVDLHKSLGRFYPAGGVRILDTHHMDSPAATLV